MINNILNNEGVVNDSIKQNQDLVSIEKSGKVNNPYAKITDFVDETDISSMAKELCERDRELQKYKDMVLGFDQDQSNKLVGELINSGDFKISDDDLTDSLLNSEEFINSVFS